MFYQVLSLLQGNVFFRPSLSLQAGLSSEDLLEKRDLLERAREAQLILEQILVSMSRATTT